MGDKTSQAADEFNIGHAYKDLPAIRDLNAAEAAYQRSLDLCNSTDALARSRCIKQIGMVHHERFNEALQRKEPEETLQRHARAAEARYLEALRLCPKNALTELGPKHNQLGNLYQQVGQLDSAREHYEHAAQYFEKAGARFQAGVVRFNMALMYTRASEREERPFQQHAILLRARAYAEAALRDFQQYQGRADAEEAKVQGFLDDINQALADLPE
jgi:tetratricopeptide (TPR) repeat protein